MLLLHKCWTQSITPRALHHTRPSRGLAPLCTDRKPTRSSSPLGTCGQRPRAFNCLLGPSSGNCVASAYGEQRKPQLAIAL